MPPRFPFFRFPYPSRMYYPRYPTPYINKEKEHIVEKNKFEDKEPEKKEEINKNRNNSSQDIFSNLFSFIPTSIGPLNFHPEALSNNELPLFEMFGIHLFLDDVIIICILIFLYKEEVSDQMLYISLFLLLIA